MRTNVPRVASSLAPNDLFQLDGKEIHPALLTFLELFNVSHQGTIESINKGLQKNFLRPLGSEVDDLSDTAFDRHVRLEALALLEEMGLVTEIPSTPVEADYFILFGSLWEDAVSRLNDFLHQYQAGTLRCHQIVLLGGCRKLAPEEQEKIARDVGVAMTRANRQVWATETDMWRLLWQLKAPLSLQNTFREHEQLWFIHDTDVSRGRPTTDSTLTAWWNQCLPAPGWCHANVEQPYGMRMEKCLRTFLEKVTPDNATKQFSITWNAASADPALPLVAYKDTLARVVYQTLLLHKEIKN